MRKTLPHLGYPGSPQVRIATPARTRFNTGMNLELAIAVAIVAADLVLLGLYGRRPRARR